MHKDHTPGHQLCITLHYMATGDSYHSLMYNYRVPHNTISKIISETYQAIVNEFGLEVLACPMTKEDWQLVADQFSQRWQFHNCFRAIDGKQFTIKCPPKSGFYYFNYKHFHSIVLLALVDANYKFLYADIGAKGSASDRGIFTDSNIYKALKENTAGIPPLALLPNDNQLISYVIVGDDAFGLCTWLMMPHPHHGMTYPERIFNYRLSRAWRVSENAFGYAFGFRCILITMQQRPETVGTIVLAATVMHNLLLTCYPGQTSMDSDEEDPVTHRLVPGAWRDDDTLVVLDRLAGNTSLKVAKIQCEYLTKYYNSLAGSVPWQDKMA